VRRAPRKVPTKPRRRTRLAAAEREQQIITGAIRYFAEVGFGGRTRELAARLGVTQPLLYRYFPTKKDLVERVFAEVFLKRIDPAWTRLIRDRSRPLEERLQEFYRLYSRATYSYEWIRIYMFSALLGNDINRRYIGIVEKTILKPICMELRHACGLPGARPSALELDHVWVMHGGLFYYAVRKYVYRSRVGGDFAAVVRRAVATMIAGLRAAGAKGERRTRR